MTYEPFKLAEPQWTLAIPYSNHVGTYRFHDGWYVFEQLFNPYYNCAVSHPQLGSLSRLAEGGFLFRSRNGTWERWPPSGAPDEPAHAPTTHTGENAA